MVIELSETGAGPSEDSATTKIVLLLRKYSVRMVPMASAEVTYVGDVDTRVDNVNVDAGAECSVVVGISIVQRSHSARNFVRVRDAAETPGGVGPAATSWHEVKTGGTK